MVEYNFLAFLDSPLTYSSSRKVINLTPKIKTKRPFAYCEQENQDTFTQPHSPNNDLVHSVFKKLEHAGCLNDFITSLHLVNKDKFPLDNISFLLFLDTARFLGLSNSSQMTYPHQTKYFWKAGNFYFIINLYISWVDQNMLVNNHRILSQTTRGLISLFHQ